MTDVKTETMTQWSLMDYDKIYFLAAMSKLYKEVNKVGFDHLGLTREERYAFNDVVEQLAINNASEE